MVCEVESDSVHACRFEKADRMCCSPDVDAVVGMLGTPDVDGRMICVHAAKVEL